MTREEQIIEAGKIAAEGKEFSVLVNRQHRTMSAYEIGFIEGAQWADESILEKIEKYDLSTYGRLHNCWHGMIQRCTNPKATGYKNYGGVGIKVCHQWRKFYAFAIWSLLNGYDDSLSIDRINARGDYCPDNCRWATSEQQANNTTRNVKFEGKTISELSKEHGIKYRTLHNRLMRNGMTLEEAISATPYNPLPVCQFDKNGNFIAEYNSVHDATDSLGAARHNHISDVCRGKRKMALGYIWKYKKDCK